MSVEKNKFIVVNQNVIYSKNGTKEYRGSTEGYTWFRILPLTHSRHYIMTLTLSVLTVNRMEPLGVSRSSFSIGEAALASFQVVLILTLCSTIAIRANDKDHEEQFCTFAASINLTSVVRNGTGFLTESGYFFPLEATRFKGGVRYGCICDIKQCLNICPLFGTEKSAKAHEDYVDFSAIPRVYTTNQTIDRDVETQSPEQRFHTLERDPCPEKRAFVLEPMRRKNYAFYLLRNGSLFMPLMDNPRLQFVESNEYCLQLLDDGSAYVPRICYSEDYDVLYEDFVVLENVGDFVALPFLLATVIVYSIIPEFKSIHGITLRCYLCSLIAFFVALEVQLTIGAEQAHSPNTFCLCLGFTIYFIFLASFLWLNVICFDTWSRFSAGKFFRKSSMHDDRKKIIAYSVYAWGLSAVLTAICIIMEFAPGVEESAFNPGFRMNFCWFYTMQMEALYLYGPVGVTIASNIYFIVWTSVRLVRHNKDTQTHLSTEESERQNDNEQWFRLHLKFFVVMMVTWSTEIISWLWQGPKYVWYSTNMTNAVQGILIFVIFVCKRNIWWSLKKRFTKSKPCVLDYELPDRIRVSSDLSTDSLANAVLS